VIFSWKRLSKVTSLLFDQGPFANEARTLPDAPVQVAQRNELHTLIVMPQH